MTGDVDEDESDDCDQGSLSIEFDEVIGDDSAVLYKIERVFRAELCLSPFSSKIAVQYLRSRLSDQNVSADFLRVTGYVLDMINKHSGNIKANVTPCAGQMGCPNVIRGLRAFPIWDTHELPWVRELEAAGPAICEELMALRGHNSFQPYRAPILNVPPTSSNYLKPENSIIGFDSLGALATSKGDWNVCYLHLHGENFTDCLERCPRTAAAIG
jgi:aspartate beta-hydroxylase